MKPNPTKRKNKILAFGVVMGDVVVFTKVNGGQQQRSLMRIDEVSKDWR
jgi:hypothetical protein